MFELHARAKVGDEAERVELNQDVVTNVTFNTKTAGPGEQFGFRAPLQRIRSDGEIPFSPQLKITRVTETDRDAGQRRKVGRRLEGWMKAPDRKREDGRRTPIQTHRHAAGQRKLVHQA